MDALTRTLTSGVHPAEIKSILAASKGVAEAAGELKRSSVLPLVRAAAMAGRHWAQGFLGLIKTSELRIGSYDYEKDLDRMLQELNARPRESDYVKDRLRTGQSVKQVLGHNRTVARTAAMNIYAKAALTEFSEDGLKLCRRMEVHDDRTSPICRVLNGTIHDIRKLLSYTFPLTHDSHPNCRGTFVPHFGLGAYRPHHREMPVSVSVGKFENAPIEFIPWLRGIGKKTIFDKIIFTPLPGDMESKVEKNILFIDPQDEEDPRDIILHREGELLYPIFSQSFHEVESLTKSGIVHPEKSHDTPEEHFIHLYQAYRLHQIDDPILVAWFSSHLH